MRKGCLVVLIAFGLAAMPTGAAQNAPASRKARLYRAEVGRILPSGANATKPERLARFLRGKGASNETVNSVRILSESTGRNGVTHLRGEQEVSGLRVHNAGIKAAFNADGELIHVIDDLAPVNGGLTRASTNEAMALQVALAMLYPGLNATLPQQSRSENISIFAKTGFFHEAPRVERVAIPMSDGTLEEGFLVETWTERGNQLHETLVSASGRVLEVVSRTNTDSYNVITNNPDKTPQTVKPGPGPGVPGAWLFPGSHTTQNIAGNNVHAYLDAEADNRPDGGGTSVADGNFLTNVDLLTSPSTIANRNVAVQNLFYLNNFIHDDLYLHGFNEAAGNFQEDNYGLAKRKFGSDSVDAEAQDGSEPNNGTFSSPRDGKNPRMQIGLFSGVGDHEVRVNSPISESLRAQGASFGGTLDTTGVTADVTLVNDGTDNPSDGCEPLATGSLTGRIALIDRGTCLFTDKVKNAQTAGAVAAIIAYNEGDTLIFAMAGSDPAITISAVMIGKSDGTLLKANLTGLNATSRRAAVQPLQRDATLDSDIVFHEYGHGLTWRMIDRMSGSMAGAIGEGMSDVLAIIYNEDDRVGEYSADTDRGIRSAPYKCFPRTFISVQGTEIHYDGEVYGAIGWRLFELFGSTRKGELLDYLVEGMNFTPPAPTFEEMRDGILAAIDFSGGSAAGRCMVWRAFAKYGVGVGAISKNGLALTESFDIPLDQQGACADGPTCPPAP